MEDNKQNIQQLILKQQQLQPIQSISFILHKNGQYITINKKNFQNFQIFIHDQNLDYYLKDMNYFNPQKDILHVFLYFILNVGKQIIKDPTYEQICRQKVAHFYIRKKMKVQIYQYSLICSRILTTKVQFCLHILYFLVYGRYASNPYIQSICNNKKFKHRKALKMKTTKPFKQIKSKNGSISKNMFEKDYQFKKFKKELGDIFKRNSADQKISYKKPNTQRTNLNLGTLKNAQQNENSAYLINAPILATRIQNRQNSALIQTLSKVIPKSGKFLRKKKFEDVQFTWINQSESFNKLQQGQKEEQIQSRDAQFSKKTAHNFSSITQSLKNSSKVLDKIRNKQLQITAYNNRKTIKGSKTFSPRKLLDLQQQLQLLQKKNLQEQKKYKQNKEREESDSQSIQEEKPQQMRNLLRKDQSENTDYQNQNIFHKFLSLNKRPILRTGKYKQQYRTFLNNLIFNFQFQDDYTL